MSPEKDFQKIDATFGNCAHVWANEASATEIKLAHEHNMTDYLRAQVSWSALNVTDIAFAEEFARDLLKACEHARAVNRERGLD